ncbi:MAG: hypothetical protein ACREVL_00550, partial [Solimonas sp.]
ATAPFCCAMGRHDSRRHVTPTLQVVARPLAHPSPALLSMLLESQLEQFSKTYRNFELLDASSRASIDGCAATLIRGRFALDTEVDGERVEMAVLTRGYIVFAGHLAFSVGLSSSADPAYYDEADFAAIVSSIRIGHAA